MAIDSAPKRRAISGILSGLTIVGVTMDATPDAAWRQSAGWGYLGIEVELGIAGPVTKRDGIFRYAHELDGLFSRVRKQDGRFTYSRKRPGVLA